MTKTRIVIDGNRLDMEHTSAGTQMLEHNAGTQMLKHRNTAETQMHRETGSRIVIAGTQ
jgi:hypothetical protein